MKEAQDVVPGHKELGPQRGDPEMLAKKASEQAGWKTLSCKAGQDMEPDKKKSTSPFNYSNPISPSKKNVENTNFT